MEKLTNEQKKARKESKKKILAKHKADAKAGKALRHQHRMERHAKKNKQI